MNKSKRFRPKKREVEKYRSNEKIFAKELRVDYAHFNKFVPYPGTELYKSLTIQGYKFDFTENSSIISHSDMIYIPESFTKKQFRRFLDSANREYYLRPSYILQRLANIRTFEEFKGQVKGFFAIARL